MPISLDDPRFASLQDAIARGAAVQMADGLRFIPDIAYLNDAGDVVLAGGKWWDTDEPFAVVVPGQVDIQAIDCLTIGVPGQVFATVNQLGEIEDDGVLQWRAFRDELCRTGEYQTAVRQFAKGTPDAVKAALEAALTFLPVKEGDPYPVRRVAVIRALKMPSPDADPVRVGFLLLAADGQALSQGDTNWAAAGASNWPGLLASCAQDFDKALGAYMDRTPMSETYKEANPKVLNSTRALSAILADELASPVPDPSGA